MKELYRLLGFKEAMIVKLFGLDIAKSQYNIDLSRFKDTSYEADYITGLMDAANIINDHYSKETLDITKIIKNILK